VELVDLRRELKDVHLETRHDVLLSWTLEPLGKFSARSLYRKLGHTEETLWVALEDRHFPQDHGLPLAAYAQMPTI
jgi:hypothetical protein